jgi:flagellar biosynthesis/type III secretory pathway protein FliH
VGGFLQRLREVGVSDAETRELNEGRPQGWRRKPLLAALAILVGAGAAIGGYFIGYSTGEDLDAAREAGAAAGREAGSARGAEQGYAQGFKEGRKKGYQQTYASAYEEAYRKAYDEAGLTPPKKVSVPEVEGP